MPKIHVAYRTDVGGPGIRFASGSNTILRQRLGQVPGSHWTIGHYNLPNNVQSLCQCIEDMVQVPYEEDLEKVHVTASGRVRKVE